MNFIRWYFRDHFYLALFNQIVLFELSSFTMKISIEEWKRTPTSYYSVFMNYYWSDYYANETKGLSMDYAEIRHWGYTICWRREQNNSDMGKTSGLPVDDTKDPTANITSQKPLHKTLEIKEPKLQLVNRSEAAANGGNSSAVKSINKTSDVNYGH